MTRYRALIICTQFQAGRKRQRARHFLQPVTGLQIAAQLDKTRFDIRLYHEDWQGAFASSNAHGYDLVILTGLQAEFDRMRQLSYAFRKSGALVVAGGTICSLFPEFASQFFDVVCTGGVEAVAAVAEDFLSGQTRSIYASPYLRATEQPVDFGLLTRAGIRSPVHFIEGSRGCRFKCSFCVIPVEGGGHVPYATAHVDAAIRASIASSPWLSIRRWYPIVVFLDNNFADNPRQLDEMLTMLKHNKKVRGWSAMVTQNILRDHPLIARMAASKCRALFVGLESLDPAALRRYNKKQNLGGGSVIDDIRHAERLGVPIGYGYMLDPRFQTAAAMRADIQAITATRDLPMPMFMTLVSPLVGTASFWEDVAAKRLAPNLRLRDLDGETVAFRATPSDPQTLSRLLSALFQRTWTVTGRRQVLAKALVRVGRAKTWNPIRLWAIFGANLHGVLWARACSSRRSTYLAGEDVLDPQYADRPPDLTPEDRARYFDPIAITDAAGAIMPWLEPYAPAPIAGRQLERI